MEMVQIYQCLCDVTRLRILHLLGGGPLCVCHLQEILKLPQTKVSQHLAYLRKHGMVECRRAGTWMVYRLPSRAPAALVRHLQCLQDCAQTDPRMKADRKALAKMKIDRQALEAGRANGRSGLTRKEK